MRKYEGLLRRQRSKVFLLGCLYLILRMGFELATCAPASAQQPNEIGSAPVQKTSAPVEEKRFRWSTTGKIYLRYGGIRTPRPTNLFGFKRAGEEELTNEETEELFQSYHSPSLKTGDIRLDLYELLLGFEASSAKEKKWQGKARVALDAFALGARLSKDDWGGPPVDADDFDSAGVRDASVSLAHVKFGELRLGITEGVVRKLDAGAGEISSGNGFFGDVSPTPWHIRHLGWELGGASSENFPKIQYLTPKFYGISIGAEWFSNLRKPENSLKTFARDSSSYCFPSLFYNNNQRLFEQDPGYPFTLYDNTDKPFGTDVFEESLYYLQNDFLPNLVSDARCWQRSSAGSSWHEDARPSVMGGNVAVAYEKDFQEKKLSLKFAARYGIRSSNATTTEPNEVLKNLFDDKGSLSDDDPALQRINRSARVVEQAVGFATGVTWKEQSFFGNITYQFPSSIDLESVGGTTLSEKGAESILWSVGIKTSQPISRKKGSDGKRKKKSVLSVSFTQAFTKDPRYDGGKQEKTFLLNLQSLYPITKDIAFVANYWYGEAAVLVPFFVTVEKFPSQGVLFYERRFVPTHEFVIGLKMLF